MKQKINLADIKVQDVGATCITLVSKFSRVIKTRHGVVIQLRDKNVLSKVAAYAAATGNSELKFINTQIQQEVRQYLLRTGVSRGKDIVFENQPLIVKKKNKTKTYRQI